MKNLTLTFVLTLFLFSSCYKETKKIWLSETGIANIEQGWGAPRKNLSIDGNALTINGLIYENGIGTHSLGKIYIKLDGKVKKFHAVVGVDDEVGNRGSVEFIIMADKEILWKSGILKGPDSSAVADIILKGKKNLAILVTEGGDNNGWDHADLADAWFEYSGVAPEIMPLSKSAGERYILTPPASALPKINGSRVVGASVGKPFIFRLPVTGDRPVFYSAENLPEGLSLDPETGIITGRIRKAGEYNITLTAENSLGKDTNSLKIVTGRSLAMTPTMGWNSWNCWGLEVDDAKVRAAADAFISTGLVNHGWQYINIDDGWEAPERSANGEIIANEKFPDMKNLADYVHSLGLKIGIYSSPGPKTCGGYLGSWQHEKQDARTYAKWGIDYLKYDWCSYGSVEKDTTLTGFRRPYILMDKELKAVDRDIVFSLCQYGMADVWKWGRDVGGNLWRTTGDITDTWGSMSSIGFSQAPLAQYAGPGHWNDPDMLVVGKVGWSSNLHHSKLTPDEQYTHISLWSLLSAPLLIGCDLSDMDDFTLNLLTNDEVIAVNQDPLGIQAVQVKEGDQQVWVKKLEDGSIATGIFQLSADKYPVELFPWSEISMTMPFTLKWNELGLNGKCTVRDIWRQKDLGIFEDEYSGIVNHHGVVLLKITPVK